MPARGRKSLTAQLTPGLDDDLIEWRESLPDGKRNQTVKLLLRTAIGLPVPSHPVSESTELWAEIDRLRSALANIPRLIESVHQPMTADAPTLDQMRRDVSEAFETMTGHINALVERVDVLSERMSGGQTFAPTATSTIESAPRMTDQELAQREKKLSRASW